MSQDDHTPGFFGRFPSRPNAACGRLPAAFVRPWENWLQASLRTSQRLLGGSWQEVYLSGPIWRFILQGEICGDGAWAGVLMPSLDSEGRCFPLTLAVPIQSTQARKKLFEQAANWFSHLEGYALTTMAEDFDLGQFDRSLQTLAPIGKPIRRSYLQRLFSAGSKAGQSFWQTKGCDHTISENKSFKGLPGPEAFVGLLTLHTALVHQAPEASAARAARDEAASERTQTILRPPKASAPAPAPPDQAAAISWRSWALTDVGRRREINEDAYLNRPEVGLWVVADGMGGHSAGDVASQTVARRLAQSSGAASLTTLEQNTRATLHAVNTELLGLAAEMGPGHVVGTTVVVLLALGPLCTALWAGDSRLYRHRGGSLQQLTVDHSMAVEMANTPEAMPSGYGDNIVTRALGADPALELDRIAFRARPGDLYLLCSDGLTKEVGTAELAEILNREGGRNGLRRMIDLALERQARDNVTAIVVSADAA